MLDQPTLGLLESFGLPAAALGQRPGGLVGFLFVDCRGLRAGATADPCGFCRRAIRLLALSIGCAHRDSAYPMRLRANAVARPALFGNPTLSQHPVADISTLGR